MSTKLIIPTATESDWQWREYKAYVAACGDYSECEIFKGKAVILATVKHVIPRKLVAVEFVVGQGRQVAVEPDYLELEEVL